MASTIDGDGGCEVVSETTVLNEQSKTKMTIESLATNIDSKLNLNDHISDSTISSSQCPNDEITTIKNESQSSTLSSSSSSAQTSSNTTSNVTANQNNHHHNNTNNVPKFGTPVPNRVFVGGIPDDVSIVYPIIFGYNSILF